ncbi:G-type lectin S-receptor-like serine/threonine-protein kinase [Dichanthelium oligosanthes]|uniref:Receptor-like serine/threonine-protein kinase n=1 Tax=Dichanthelium oligosanthes TaxID=888268 RepID=A0A1E5VZA9_9POAL|nr:G-type lectin S-receptor-like serine/threonine-protein kinase [Dichanthelium oligosanthes]
MAVAIHGSAWCFASDTISANSVISGGRTVVSRGGNFELGFFSPAGNRNRSYYVGIWYKKAVSQCTPVWVANRAAPVSDPASSQFAVAADGNLVLFNEAGKLVWSSNVISSAASSNGSTVAVIMDTGNLVLRREDGEFLWHSSEHPTDTWLPGVHLGLNKITGDVQALVSWKSSGDPAPGLFTMGIDPNGTSQYFTNWNGTLTFWSSGEWNGNIFAGIPEMTSHDKYDFEFVSDANASYFTYSLQDPTAISRLVLDVSGQVRNLMWVPSADEWMIVWTEPHKLCDVYAVCGAFGICNEKSEPFCSCPAGFCPSSVGDWELGDHSHGCRRNNPSRCYGSANSSVDGNDDGDAFLLAPGISLQRNPSLAQASSAHDCRLACLRNCDCTAYSYGSRCAIWYGDLLNLQRRVDDTAGMGDLYLRLSAMDVPSRGRKRRIVLVSIAAVVASILALSVIVSVLVRMFRRRQRSIGFMQAASEGGNLVAFDYSYVKKATKNFSEKLGGGSFGSVYKGTLPRSVVAIAVKKLEGLLCMGEKQFRNEVRTIGVIQHVNLVRLRGFSSRGGERLLVYDYMPNGSLDKALFGGAAAPALNWRVRFQIALGAARGLQYLHEGCRDCIIHCDIKPENILLDEGLVPKVADFGMAKLVGREFSRVLTTVRGTIGYLAPEWISGVPITAKADVYSYGMVLMEIISGRRNARCWAADEEGRLSEYFPLVAARKVSKGEALVGLLDERLNGDADEQELDRACRVACWCVQDEEARRPTMEQVVQVLEGVMTVDVPPIPASLHALSEDASFVSMHTIAYIL